MQRTIYTRAYAYIIANKALLAAARDLLADAAATVADKVAALFASIVKYGQTVDLPWRRFLDCCNGHDEITEAEHAMIVVAKFDDETPPPTMLTLGIASLIYEFGMEAPVAHFPRLLEGVKAGNGTWAEHLNAWCGQ